MGYKKAKIVFFYGVNVHCAASQDPFHLLVERFDVVSEYRKAHLTNAMAFVSDIISGFTMFLLTAAVVSGILLQGQE